MARSQGAVVRVMSRSLLQPMAQRGGLLTVNLGTGKGYSVLDVVRAFEAASGRDVAYKFAPRRAGDIAECFADPALAVELIGWRATRGINEMCVDAWRWQNGNPEGYDA